jgi:predicted dehydrogenase
VTGARPIALIGAGRIGGDWLAAVAAEPRWRLAAIVEPRPEPRARAADAAGVPAFASLEAMFAESTPDAAIVATPPATHEPLVLALLERRVHVLCEKPFALGAAAAQRIVHAAGRHGRVVMMAAKYRFVPEAVTAREIVAAGELGDPVAMQITFCAAASMAGRWNADAQVAGGGVLADHGPHAFDVVRAFAGPIQRVFAHFGRRVQQLDVEDSAHVLAEAQRGLVAAIDLSWSVDAHAEHWLELRGSAGSLRLGWQGGQVRRRDESGWRPFGGRYDKRLAFARQLGNFAGVADGGEAPRITPDDALDSVRAVEAAYRSAASGRWVPLPRREGA